MFARMTAWRSVSVKLKVDSDVSTHVLKNKINVFVILGVNDIEQGDDVLVIRKPL